MSHSTGPRRLPIAVAGFLLATFAHVVTPASDGTAAPQQSRSKISF